MRVQAKHEVTKWGMRRVVDRRYVVQNNKYKLYERNALLQVLRRPPGGPLVLCKIKQYNDPSGCHTLHPLSGTLFMSQPKFSPQIELELETHNICGSNLLQPLFYLIAEPLNGLIIDIRRDINRLVTRKCREIGSLSTQESVIVGC